MKRLLLLTLFTLFGYPLSGVSAPASPLPYELLAQYPHDTRLFTQGLELYQGQLYESSGLFGHSKLISRPFPPKENSPPTLRGVALDKRLFAEGLSFYRGRLFVLTWRAGLALELDPQHFGLLKQHRYQGQGWGLCYHSGREMFAMSDGSDTLQWRRPGDFALVSRQKLWGHDHIDKLNELECHGDYILANRWYSNEVLVIDARNTKVLATLDLSALQPEGLSPEAVLNGIAFDESDQTWLVTGKLWPYIYRIAFTLPSINTAVPSTAGHQ